MTSITVHDLTVAYPLIGVKAGDREMVALSDISFALDEGDRLGLVGGNGAGKTTLLRTLAGLIYPRSGDLVIEGRVQSMMEMGLGVNGDATGRENIRLRLLAEGLNWREAEAAAGPIEAYSDLGEYLDLPVETYSRGMQLRLSFSIVTSIGADILVMDEWVGAGDAAFKDKAAKRMAELVENAGIVVLASHNNNLLKRTCNKGLWLEQGRARAFGPIEDIIDQYAVSLN